METAIHDAEIDTALAEPATAQDGHEDEQKLADEIRQLWAVHTDAQATVKKTREELKAIRQRLSERLYEMKQLLVKPGRNGGWSSFLRSQGIAKPTADRLVRAHKESIDPEPNVLSEQVSEASQTDVQRLFESVWPRLRKVLTTDESVNQFIGCIVTASGVAHERRQEGLMIFNAVPEAANELTDSASPQSDPASQPSDDGDAEERATEAAAAPTTEAQAGDAEANSGEAI